MNTRLFVKLASLSIIGSLTLNAGFNPETPVNTPYGARPIGALAVGDKVICMNKRFEPKERMVKTVEDTESDALVEITTHTGTVLQVSPNQQMYIATKRMWVPAYELALGDILITQDKKPVRVRSVRLIENKTKLRFITVDKHENFVAGKEGIVAHNGPITGWTVYCFTKACCYVAAVAAVATTATMAAPIVAPMAAAGAVGATAGASLPVAAAGAALAANATAAAAATSATATVVGCAGSIAAANAAVESFSVTVGTIAGLLPFLP